MSKRIFRVAAIALTIAAAGCAGSDGKDGAPGAPGARGPQGDPGPIGTIGPPGQDAPSPMVELCGGCHGGTLAAKHAQNEQLHVVVTASAASSADPEVVVSNFEGAGADDDLLIDFTVKVNGVARIDFGSKASVVRNHNEDAWWVWDVTSIAGVRTKISSGNWVLEPRSGGYRIKLQNFLTTNPVAAQPGAAFMFSVMNPLGLTATVVAHMPGTPAHQTVSDGACKACHGRYIWRDRVHDVTYPPGVAACIVCHNRAGAADPMVAGTTDVANQPIGTIGSGLMGIAHGIHNSKNMPDKTYTFTWTNYNQFNFSIGFPGYMINCATCHQDPAGLPGQLFTGIANAPASWVLCMSCHDTMAGIPRTQPGSHANWNRTTNCSATNCHDGTGATLHSTVSEFHNGFLTERAGVIWDGRDLSVTEGKRFQLAITGVAFEPANGSTLAVTWTAAYDPTGQGTIYLPVDPCNADYAAGPVFFRAVASTTGTGEAGSQFSILRAYAVGDDWVGGPGTTEAGQPFDAVSATTLNTTCASNVAKTLVRTEQGASTFARGVVALQGKPQVRWDPAIGTSTEIMAVRAKSPLREFVPATGAVPAGSPRRDVVSTEKCNACHLGTLYQHGGNRVDNVQLCDLCHNPASNEKSVRLGYGVDATEAYDGKAGETFDMRTMIHAIHSSGETAKGYVVYRSRGIYFFGPKASLPSTWPTPNDPVGVSTTVYGGTRSQVHNIIEVEYPRPLNDCDACHVSNVTAFPDPSKAVAVTVDPGAAPWSNIVDDVLQGPSASSCMSCHQSTDVFRQYGLRAHAYDQGWTPVTFPNGRQTLIDAAP